MITMLLWWWGRVNQWSVLSSRRKTRRCARITAKLRIWHSWICLERGGVASFCGVVALLRASVYRPFTKRSLFFDRILNEEVYQLPHFLPTRESEIENSVICVTNHSQVPFVVQMTNLIPEVANGGRTGQCFPFYTYDEDGTNQRENITDWALEQFQTHYDDTTISKWHIFHYVYGLLHHPDYRSKYAKNLKQSLAHIAF